MRDHNLRPVSTDLHFRAEVRLIRWGESSTAGRTITLELPPDEGDGHPFKGFPTGHAHGQRFWMAFDPIADDEQPIPVAGSTPNRDLAPAFSSDVAPDRGRNRGNFPHDSSVLDGGAKSPEQPGCGTAGLTPTARYAAKSPEQKAVTRAAILCGEAEFRTWLAGEDITVAQAAEVLRERCGVESRGEFLDNPEALARFEKMEADYRFLKRLPEQR